MTTTKKSSAEKAPTKLHPDDIAELLERFSTMFSGVKQEIEKDLHLNIEHMRFAIRSLREERDRDVPEACEDAQPPRDRIRDREMDILRTERCTTQYPGPVPGHLRGEPDSVSPRRNGALSEAVDGLRDLHAFASELAVRSGNVANHVLGDCGPSDMEGEASPPEPDDEVGRLGYWTSLTRRYLREASDQISRLEGL